jgi:hypothetical protein
MCLGAVGMGSTFTTRTEPDGWAVEGEEVEVESKKRKLPTRVISTDDVSPIGAFRKSLSWEKYETTIQYKYWLM